MLFNSYAFLFVFLPIVFAGFWLLHRHASVAYALTFLLLASLVFYSYWNPPYVALLVISILLNHRYGAYLRKVNGGRRLLGLGIVLNLLPLAYFKYTNFGFDLVSNLGGWKSEPLAIFLPLGISFFTFQQITYLCDLYHRKLEPAPLREYALFVSFFPHLLAGPITQAKEIIPQFTSADMGRRFWFNTALGLSLFIMGLFKKVVIADTFATFANPVFKQALNGREIFFLDGWIGALSYTFQLYFDFSGYSDMAIGLGLMFGILMPMNFLSPYKSASIIDFWRRWHMTMSRFFRDYVYIPLGGSHEGYHRQLFNLLLTMVVAGLWHGAGWTFIFWGFLHGLYLMINHLYRRIRERNLPGIETQIWHILGGHCLTFLAVIVGWVFFRAESFDAAFRILEAMAGLNGVALPSLLSSMPFGEANGFLRYAADRDNWMTSSLYAFPWILGGYAACLILPSSMRYFRLSEMRETGFDLQFQFHMREAWTIGAMLVVSIFSLQRISEFLYFQF